MVSIVTGGCGFIGSHLARRLVSNNEDVKIIDDLSKGDISRIKDVINSIEFFKVDIRNYTEIKSIFKDVDTVFHLAAQVSVFNSIEDPSYDASVNVLGTLNVLKAAYENNVKRFVYVSSAAIYGNPVKLPIDEDHPKNPLSPYGLSKYTGERYSMLFNALYELPVTAIRPFNVYGPGQNPDDEYAGVITKFVSRILKNQSPIVYGGSQTRDFVYVSDVVDGILLAAKVKDAVGNSFNIASGTEVTIEELAKIMIKISGKKLAIEYAPPRKGDIKQSVANITKAKQILGYSPKVSLEDGLREVFKYLETRLVE